MTSDPKVLARFVFDLPFYLQTDASEFGFGALLFQTDKDAEPPLKKYIHCPSIVNNGEQVLNCLKTPVQKNYEP